MNPQTNRRHFLKRASLGAGAIGLSGTLSPRFAAARSATRPNILWICVEDMSANMSCYGETTIQTPNIDRLAEDGTKFSQAFVTCPVCSPSRSSLITGMYQTTIGAHNHRSSRHEAKIHLPEWMRLVPEYFQEAGYYTSNGGIFPDNVKRAKTDYNFVYDPNIYQGLDWSGRKPGQPFFAQLQLRGGKNRNAKVPNPVDPKEVELPPYYPDHPVLREDWARYLNSVIQTDIEVGRVIERLRDEGELENTVIFFWTDHGISHVRDKQFLYEGGIHVPLILRGPGIVPGCEIDDLVEHIDIAYTSLELAGIPVPHYFQSRSLLNSAPRPYIFSARDRCDETVERLRCVRGKRYKYIRNFHPDRPHAQPNRYKDGKQIMQTMRELYAEGKLNNIQARPFLSTRPPEELYDLKSDPHETNNLAARSDRQNILQEMRNQLAIWMEDTRDLGTFPEPELVELMKQYDSAYEILLDPKNRKTARRLRKIDRRGDLCQIGWAELRGYLHEDRSPIRYQAAMELRKLGEEAMPAKESLLNVMNNDPSESVRVAAARAVCAFGMVEDGLPVLAHELRHADNEAVRHYAALGLEDLGKDAMPAYDALQAARKDPYEYVKRVAVRVTNSLRPRVNGDK